MIESTRPAPRRYQTHTNSDSQVLLRRTEHQNNPDVETENDGFVASSMTIKMYRRTIARLLVDCRAR
jgi:hypothetical protein